MRLLYSEPKGVPYIELENGSNLGFPLFMEDKKRGWKWVVFSGKVTESVCVSGKGAKNKKYIDNTDHVGFVTDLALSSIDKNVKGKNGPLSPVVLGSLKKIFSELAPDGWLSRESLTRLEALLLKLEMPEEDRVDDDPTIDDDDDDEEDE